jgi:hypothetical protein
MSVTATPADTFQRLYRRSSRNEAVCQAIGGWMATTRTDWESSHSHSQLQTHSQQCYVDHRLRERAGGWHQDGQLGE